MVNQRPIPEWKFTVRNITAVLNHCVPSRWFNNWWVARRSLHPVGLFSCVISEPIPFLCSISLLFAVIFWVTGPQESHCDCGPERPSNNTWARCVFLKQAPGDGLQREQCSVTSLVIDFFCVKKQYCHKFPKLEKYCSWVPIIVKLKGEKTKQYKAGNCAAS